jgi:hypothetical protein
MAKTKRSSKASQSARYECVHQVGGIQTGSLDHPQPLGGRSCRVAFVNTGSGLRFTVALDRGGDIVEAFHHEHSLAYLSPNGYVPPSHGYNRGVEWLRSWPAGLVTTCGPNYMGGPREEDGNTVSLHGHHSNTPAAVVSVRNPDHLRGERTMAMELVIRDSRMFGPVIEVRRRIECTLGEAVIRIHDEVTNRGNTRVAHNWLYHVNFGFPLVDTGTQLVYRGDLSAFLDGSEAEAEPNFARLKKVPDPQAKHCGGGETVVILDPRADRRGECHVGLVNKRLKLGMELSYPLEQLPRLANWQHFGKGGSYVTGIEPFSGSLLGKEREAHPLAKQWLRPGETRAYDLTLMVHSDRAGLESLLKYDGEVKKK